MAMRLRQFVLGAMLLGWLTPSAALAQYGEYYWVWDSFANGFTVDAPEAKWFHFAAGPFVGNNGHTSTHNGGMYISAPGTHPLTGEPAFTSTVAPEGSSGLPGALDHVKWLVYMNHSSSWGYPGFDAQWDYELSCSTSISGQTYGTQFHPFGGQVSNAQDDLRLASFAMNTIDFQSYMVFDFMVTNGRIYAIYERLPFGRGTLGNYAAFTYAIPVGTLTPWTAQQTTISYDRRGGVVRWILNGVEVFRVSNIGYRIDRQWMVIDHGGVEQSVSMNQLACGMGMFSLLDAASPWGAGLVRLSSTPNFYYQPQQGTSQPLWFADESSNEGSRLFGQGARFHVGSYAVQSSLLYSPPVCWCPQPNLTTKDQKVETSAIVQPCLDYCPPSPY
jgi:hypothetical protein